ncbi:MAG: DUF4197 domain-containing protein [Chitinispirillaceae bacterium]|nr:DUF4197 domain-containing protein [Chitinispirillaceae bacterium]
MKKILLLGSVTSLLIMASCDLLSELQIDSDLTDNELVSGLKEALILGSKTAAFTLSDTSGIANALSEATGYLANELVRIVLPDDAQKAFQTINLLNSSSAGRTLLAAAGVDLSSYRDAMIRGLNRGAENAAGLSVDVFREAITGMTFTSARDILFGSDSLGATNYLNTTTSDVLASGFSPIIDNSLETVKVTALGMQYTVKGVWNEFALNYNKVAGAYQSLVSTSTSTDLIAAAAATLSLVALEASGITSVDPLNTDIVAYATGKALTGLFFMVGRQELKIRRDPAAALAAAGDFVTKTISDLIEKVFTTTGESGDAGAT